MSDVKPVLTAEGLAELDGYVDWDSGIIDVTLGGPGGETRDKQQDRHRLAALALYGQPFGFTREDLETLDDAIYAIHGPKMDGLHPGVEQLLDDLKCRIEALLPPEEK